MSAKILTSYSLFFFFLLISSLFSRLPLAYYLSKSASPLFTSLFLYSALFHISSTVFNLLPPQHFSYSSICTLCPSLCLSILPLSSVSAAVSVVFFFYRLDTYSNTQLSSPDGEVRRNSGTSMHLFFRCSPYLCSVIFALEFAFERLC